MIILPGFSVSQCAERSMHSRRRSRRSDLTQVGGKQNIVIADEIKRCRLKREKFGLERRRSSREQLRDNGVIKIGRFRADRSEVKSKEENR